MHDFNAMTKPQVIELAQSLGIEFNQRDKKDVIVEAIKASPNYIEVDESADAGDQSVESSIDKNDDQENPSQKPEKVKLSKGDKNEDLQNHPKFAKFKKGEKQS